MKGDVCSNNSVNDLVKSNGKTKQEMRCGNERFERTANASRRQNVTSDMVKE
jgi:hypothetical protein